MTEPYVLAGDIGGTKSALAFFQGCADAPRMVAERIYLNREFANLTDVIRRFTADTGLSASNACLGVAGTKVQGTIRFPNLDWRIHEEEMRGRLGLTALRFLNDLEANAIGVSVLAPEQFFPLNWGSASAQGARAMISAGTGLGMAMILPGHDGGRVLASEGGHADFAPRNEAEIALLRFLARRHDRVSVERVVSGPGLVNIYEFLVQTGTQELGPIAHRISHAADKAAAIADAALRDESAICIRAVELFLSAYGAAAGNLALTALATGGVYLGGGIAPKLVASLPTSGFLQSFAAKGRYSDLLADIPVNVVLEPKTALLGAAKVALEMRVA
ncbi:glucose 6-kinase [Burkholderiales bacterium GJ-E10]|nr:glucose 6-kinase [Burkholderiales bacterium GJ-E10]